MQIAGRDIDRVAIVDDDEASRQSVVEVVEDMNIEPCCPQKLPELSNAISKVTDSSNAVISDHRLNVNGFSPFNGAELVAELYKRNYPALLSTSWSGPAREELVPYRKWIPKVLEPPLNPDIVHFGFDLCILEFNGEFRQWRKPWRALVRVEDVKRAGSHHEFFIVLPSWNSHRKIGLPLSILPTQIASIVQSGDRLHAQVNLGSEESADLYFSDWEAK